MKYALIGLMLLFGFSCQAQEVEQGTGIVCDTQAQVEQLIALHNAKVPNAEALAAINANEPLACSILPVGFFRGEVVKTVASDGGYVAITAITVVAVNNGMGWVPVPPARQFTVFRTKERGA